MYKKTRNRSREKVRFGVLASVFLSPCVATAEQVEKPKAKKTKKQKDENIELVVKEEREEGTVSVGVWLRYFKAPGTFLLFSLMILSFGVENGT